MKNVLIMSTVSTALMLQLASFADSGYTCHWVGGHSEQGWGDPENWAEGKVPGLYCTKNGDGTWVTNGSVGCTAVFGQCSSAARYVRPQESGQWELISVSNVVFETANCSAYVFTYYNGWQWGGNPVNIEPGGGIYVASEVPTAPQFDTVCFGVGSSASTTCYVENNSSTTLQIGKIDDLAFPKTTQSYKIINVQFMGTGDTRITKGLTRGGGSWYWEPVFKLAMSGGTLEIRDNSIVNLIEICTVAGYGQQHVDIGAGIRFGMTSANTGWRLMELGESLLVDGEGTFRIYSKNANLPIGIAAGKTFEVACTLENVSSGTFAEESAGGIKFVESARGVFKATGVNNISGAVEIGAVTYEASGIGMIAGTGQLGKGMRIRLSGDGRLKYTGVGETTDKTIRLDGNGAVEHVGTGELIFAGADSLSGTYILAISSVSGAAVGFAGDVSAKLTVSDGTTLALRKPSSSSAITVSSLAVSGAASVSVGDGLTATLSSVTASIGGTLNVVTAGSGTVKVSSLATGIAPSWLTINGRRASIKADGSLADASIDDVAIDAHGGIVPNAAGSAVAITTAAGPSAQNVTLAADATEVLILRQRQSIDHAMVEIGSSQVLSAGLISVEAGAKSLTLGAEAGIGAVAPSGDILEFEVKDPTGKITVNAAVSVPVGEKMGKSGAGALDLAGGFSGDVEISGGTLSVLGEGSTCANISGVGEFSAEGSPAGGFSMVSKAGRIVLSGDVQGSDIMVASNDVASLVFDGGSVASRLSVAFDQGAKGAFIVKSGEFRAIGTDAGREGLRYNLISGGRYDGPNDVQTRIAYKNDEVWEISGGMFAQDFIQSVWYYSVAIGYSKNCGVVRLTGGVMELKGDIAIPNIGDSGCGVITIDGQDAELRFPADRGIHIGMCNDSRFANEQIINLNAGKLVANHVDTYKTWSDPCQKKIVNFNGGTFNYLGGNSPFGTPGSDWEWPVDRVTVYEGGATIETASANAVAKVPFGAPTGKGVKRVLWTPVSGLVPGSQVVVVNDASGSGSGASVFAQVSDDGVLTNMVVMSSGCDYTVGQTTASLRRKSGSAFQNIATFDCELGDQVSGGLTKTGTGTLGLMAVNTYTGPTVIKNGALRLNGDNVINPASALVLDGGNIDMNGRVQTFSDFEWKSGAVLNGPVVATSLTVDFNRVLNGDVKIINSAYVEYAAGAEFVLLNYTPASLDLSRSYRLCKFVGGRPAGLPDVQVTVPDGFRLSVTDAGIRILQDRGMAIIFR